MNMNSIAFALGCSLLPVVAMSSALGDPSVDRLLGSQCAQCHGTEGYATGEMDGLAGAEFNDLYDKLIDIKYKDDHDVMHFQIQGYRDDQLARIADYFSGLPEEPGGEEHSSSED